MGEFNSHDLANISWAFSTASISAPALYEAAGAAPSKIGEFTPQALANITWAFSTAGISAPALYKAVAGEAPSKMGLLLPDGSG